MTEGLVGFTERAGSRNHACVEDQMKTASHHGIVDSWKALALGSCSLGTLSVTANADILRTPILLRSGRRQWFGHTATGFRPSLDQAIEPERVQPILFRTPRWT